MLLSIELNWMGMKSGHEKWITEAETRIFAMEDMVTLIEAMLKSLEKLVHDKAEHA